MPGRAAAAELTVTVLGTTDLHGHALDWDYVRDTPYADGAGNAVGLARCATLIRRIRAARGEQTCLTLDAGDTIQGTQLTHHFATVEPVTAGAAHPMAAALNAVGYDAASLGNHEFNYGLDVLRAYQQQLDFPLLGANVLDSRGDPAFPPFVIRTLRPPGLPAVRVGLLGLVTPGVAVWDRRNVQGRLRFDGVVQGAQRFLPRIRQAGADLVVVACHSGADAAFSSYGDRLPFPENASTQLAQRVPGIDAVLVGHAHMAVPQLLVTCRRTGEQVLLSEPLCWGMRVSLMELRLRRAGGRWRVVGRRARLLDPAAMAPDPAVVQAVAGAHARVRAHAGRVIARSAAELTGETARYAPNRLTDLVNHVQAGAVRAALAGTRLRDLPVLSVTAPGDRRARLPAGPVTARDAAGVYVHESTLVAVRMTGAQLAAHLERSAAYFAPVPWAAAGRGRARGPADLAGAPTDGAPFGAPDDDYDILGGAAVAYDIDLCRPVGERIRGLECDGAPIRPTDHLVLAVGSYRQAGGGRYREVTAAPVVYDAGRQVRDLLIGWLRDTEWFDPQRLPHSRWRLVAGGRPLA